MNVTVEYTAQLKRAAGCATESVELDGDFTLDNLVSQIAQRHGDAVSSILLHEEGGVHPSILVFVGNEQVRPNDDSHLKDGDVVSFVSPISGG